MAACDDAPRVVRGPPEAPLGVCADSVPGVSVQLGRAFDGPHEARELTAQLVADEEVGLSAGRCAGLHYGTYDYSASLGIAAAQQAMDHPAADHAKAVMQVAAAGTGVPVSDGSTNVLPVGDTEQVHAAWQLHARLVRRSLERGFYQGWDLHPVQLPTRYAATYEFFRQGLSPAVARLHAYLARRVEGIADEPATARALAGYLLRGLYCGALDDDEVPFDRSVLEAL